MKNNPRIDRIAQALDRQASKGDMTTQEYALRSRYHNGCSLDSVISEVDTVLYVLRGNDIELDTAVSKFGEEAVKDFLISETIRSCISLNLPVFDDAVDWLKRYETKNNTGVVLNVDRKKGL